MMGRRVSPPLTFIEELAALGRNREYTHVAIGDSPRGLIQPEMMTAVGHERS